MRNEWSPSSWRQYPAEQQPDWPDEERVSDVLREISDLPPLVFAGEARTLREQLAEVCNGKALLLQAGDCAESFDSLSADAIRDNLKVILQMAVALTYSAYCTCVTEKQLTACIVQYKRISVAKSTFTAHGKGVCSHADRCT